MKRIVLIDDEPAARKSLRLLLENYCPDVEIVGEASGVATGVRLIRQTSPQVALLDISLEDGTGFDLLDMFPNLDFKVVFTTAHDEFALKAFRYNALDYLLKPISPKELIGAIGRIAAEPQDSYSLKINNLLENNRLQQFPRLALASQDGLFFLRLDQIVHLQSDGNYTTFHLISKERHLVARPLHEFEEMLPATFFFRIHQSHLVNLAFVKKILKEEGGYAVMENGSQLPVARRRKEEFLETAKRFGTL